MGWLGWLAGLTGWGSWAKKLQVTQRDKSPNNKKKNFSTTRPALLVKNLTSQRKYPLLPFQVVLKKPYIVHRVHIEYK